MTTDHTNRELLGLAAKAAGIEVWFPRMSNGRGGVLEPCHTSRDGESVEWNPLTDDGDALRLVVQLNLHISQWGDTINAYLPGSDWHVPAQQKPGELKQSTMRRAITQAAAEIGRRMK